MGKKRNRGAGEGSCSFPAKEFSVPGPKKGSGIPVFGREKTEYPGTSVDFFLDLSTNMSPYGRKKLEEGVTTSGPGQSSHEKQREEHLRFAVKKTDKGVLKLGSFGGQELVTTPKSFRMYRANLELLGLGLGGRGGPAQEMMSLEEAGLRGQSVKKGKQSFVEPPPRSR